jgi:type IX secretion system PorP/SprF family membrane protein
MKKFLLLIFIFIGVAATAQDMQFTQFYSAPMYLNPAYTGLNACSRLSGNYRNQWGNISSGYVSQIIAYDHFSFRFNSGFGFMFTNDQAGTGKLRSSSYNLLYAYELPLTRKWMFRAGMQATWTVHTIDFYKLIFGDQLARGGALTTIETPGDLKTSYFDVSSGGLFYSEKYWAGFSALHLNTPNVSLMNSTSPLPTKFSIHGGARLPLKAITYEDEQKRFITPTILYKFQEKFDQVDVGAYVTQEPFIVGLWYRGIPGFKAYQPGYQNNDAVAIILGFTKGSFKAGYSYDLTVSRLVGFSSGSHELSMSYQFCKPTKKRKKYNAFLVPCPKF